MPDDKIRIRHILKDIAHLMGKITQKMDDLCDALNIGKAEDDKTG